MPTDTLVVTRQMACFAVLLFPGGVSCEHWHPSGESQRRSVEFLAALVAGGDLPLLHRLPRRASGMELHDQPGGPGSGLCSLPFLYHGWVSLYNRNSTVSLLLCYF